MPIVVSRKTGNIISQPEYTREQIDAAAEKMLRNWMGMFPEMLKQLERSAEVETDCHARLRSGSQ